MRYLLFITLMFSMAFAPAMASASCSSMDADSAMMMADDAAPLAGNGAINSDDTGANDMACASTCTLVCPGFFSRPELASADAPGFKLAQHIIPAVDPGIAMPANLDPPPPRF